MTAHRSGRHRFLMLAPSERVLERAGFTREAVVRSLPIPGGARVDKTLFSLLPGD